MCLNRRLFLQGSASSLIGASALGGLGTALTGMSARAADVSGYKAMVCVFLLGGMDSHDMVIPYDQASYNDYAAIRTQLIGQYAGGRDRANLRPLSALNPGAHNGREFALPPEMPGLHALFESGNAAIVGNVGPLIYPMDRADWEGNALTPKRLFSHNDQQATWMSSQPEGAQYGWGGLMADAVLRAGANTSDAYTAVTSLGNELFLTGELARPYQVSVNETPSIDLLDFYASQQQSDWGATGYNTLRSHFSAADFNGTHLIGRDIADAMQTTLEANETFALARDSAPPLATIFPDNNIGRQLQAVAETIAIRNSLSVDRQVFFAGTGGYDTHSAQANSMPVLLGQLDGAISAFHAAMVELGMDQDVTLFTASDFGRTLSINGDGTDHGWGSHHVVVGGGTVGQTIHGFIPPPSFGHDWDAGRGRLIPSVSVEQFAAPLGRWFGLNDLELAQALPNLGNFGGIEPGFI